MEFKSKLVLYCDDEYLLCKLFSATLQGEAWANLWTKFTQRFIHNWSRPKKMSDLLDIKQGDGKSSKIFIIRFSEVVVVIDNADKSVMIKAFPKGISHKELNF